MPSPTVPRLGLVIEGYNPMRQENLGSRLPIDRRLAARGSC